ncbi:ATP-binding cassette domain-containing protein [Streptomyces sp. NPDC006879]|uniref:ATP-binding cassette domain-containing protein n=1 Tax=Streptomyces sp. NPDC006879 TaxID=3364767 RepID=UPI00369C3315
MTSGPSATDADSVLRAAARHSAGRTTSILLCSTGSAAASLAEPLVLGRSVELLLADAPGAARWTLWCALLIVVDVLLDATVAWLTASTGARSTGWLRRRGIARLLATFPHHAARIAPGDLSTRMTALATEAGTVPATAASALSTLLAPVGALIALLLVDLWTALAFVAGLPLLLLLLRSFARDCADSVTRYQHHQSTIADRLLEALAGARSIAAAGTIERERERILAGLPELSREGRQMWRVYGGAVARSGVLLPLLVCVVLAVGGTRLTSGAISVGELIAATRYAAIAAGVGAATGLLGSLVRGRSAAGRTAEVLNLPTIVYGTAAPAARGPGALELRGVSVHRDGRPVLNRVDVSIPGGSTAAVVGRSGSGKSVLAAVAGRLTDPDEGQVLLDGDRLDSFAAAELRQEVSYAFARPALFGADVRSALSFGAVAPNEAELRAAARAAGAADFIGRLPDAYATSLSRAPLSGGELQRLGLARAFAHAGRLLVLDDATSSLDTVTERVVERALAEQVRAGTRLLVAHRLSTAARSDLVIWLEDGRVRASGPHHLLWAREPDYRGVFAARTPHGEPEQDPSSATGQGAVDPTEPVGTSPGVGR